jgi:DNA polymerase-3 subunit epsilon
MQLKITKSLVFFDIEATGLSIGSDRIVSIALIKYNPDGSEETLEKIVNPEIPIPVEISEIHGIYDLDVKDKPAFGQVAPEVAAFIGDADLAGFNSNKFDIPMLVEEFMRVGFPFSMEGRSLIDVQNIFHKKEERTLSAAYKFYCNTELENAHNALADVVATAKVFMAQLDKYPDLNTDVPTLHSFSRMGQKNLDFAGRIVEGEKGEPVFNFGKHKGKSVIEVLKKEPSYYHWMMQGDFARYTKEVLTKIKEKAGL